MATTTFSGPIKAGTIRQGASENLGFTLMAQSAVIDIIGATNTSTIGIIPANSQITDVVLNVTTVNNDSGAATVSVGTVADADAFIATQTVKGLATTHGTLDTEATNVGTTDLQILADFTGASGDATTGACTVTVLYLQNNGVKDAADL